MKTSFYAVAIAVALSFVLIIVLFLQSKRNNEAYEQSSITLDENFPDNLDTSGKNMGLIPNRIWTFWDGSPTEFVSRCINTWKKHNPDYEITILNKENYRNYIDDDVDSIPQSKDSIAKYSDYVRIAVLAKYGGFWIDSTIIMHAPLTWVHAAQHKHNSECIGFYIVLNDKDKFPVIESWFFACVPNSIFIKDWYNEFFSSRNFPTTQDYVNYTTSSGIVFNSDIKDYLSIHLAAQKIIQENPFKYNLHLFSIAKGPFSFLVDADWNLDNAISLLLGETTHQKYHQTPIIKLRGWDREKIMHYSKVEINRLFS